MRITRAKARSGPTTVRMRAAKWYWVRALSSPCCPCGLLPIPLHRPRSAACASGRAHRKRASRCCWANARGAYPVPLELPAFDPEEVVWGRPVRRMNCSVRFASWLYKNVLAEGGLRLPTSPRAPIRRRAAVLWTCLTDGKRRINLSATLSSASGGGWTVRPSSATIRFHLERVVRSKAVHELEET
jgi:hypothetical protein